MSVNNDSEIPQWKKDLIARLRHQNKRTANVVIERQQQQQQQLYPPQSTTSMVVESSTSTSSSVQQVNRCESVSITKHSNSDVIKSCNNNNNNNTNKMVQESVCNWGNNHHYKNGDGGDDDDENYYNNKFDDNDSDKNSEDDLHYGPGIVNKLKNKYLSLVLRESNNTRLTILPMRKATSLENILDDSNDDDQQFQQQQQQQQNYINSSSNNTYNLYKKFTNNESIKNQTNRYRKMTRGNEKIIVKRARSVETVSRHKIDEINNEIKQEEKVEEERRIKRESMPEEMLINFNNNNNNNIEENRIVDNKQLSSSSSSSYPSNTPRINRPKRVQPVVNEKEKPPVDFVKQTKLIFERHRPELYKKSTTTTTTTNGSDVAAKVQTYKNIIVKNKNNKPPIKQKPTILKINDTKTIKLKSKINNDEISIMKTPPDISQLDIKNNYLSSDTPDLIITSSPVSPTSSSSSLSSYHLKITTENFIKEEIRNNLNNNDNISLQMSPIRNVEVKDKEKTEEEDNNINNLKQIPPQTMINIDKASTTMTYNFMKLNNKIVLNDKTPINQPLKLDTTITASTKIIEKIHKLASPPLKSSSTSATTKPALTMLEIEKNMINTAKTLEQPTSIDNISNNHNNNNNNSCNSNNNSNSSENNLQKVPKFVKKPSTTLIKREPENNSIVFKFTDRKDVPDYLHDDGLIRIAKIERPKVGEGGIILLPGASIEESFTDDDDDDETELMRSLEAPPSPCDVTFVNDNILIDGKSSLITQKTKKNSKLKISFVEAGPEIYEYPSETSFVIDDTVVKQQQQQQQQQMGGHTVPSLSGSTLANYTPKSTEEFQPGVTRTTTLSQLVNTNDTLKSNDSSNNETILQETEKPIVFSAGANSDILF